MEFEPVIGFEVHAELATATKVFCGCKNEFGASPNTNVCPVCLGMPGALPVLNKKAAEFSVMASMALNCEITEHSTFDRKNYYYPDLPKNYQISEQYNIIGVNGWIDIPVNGEPHRVRINNVHLEEDAGKNVHPEGAHVDYSLVDLNRAGAPLLEIVSEPDMRTKEQALSYMNTLRNLLLYTGVSEAQMQKGQLRFELNISVRPKGSTELGSKVELKNLNSIRTVLRCIDYEFERQTELAERGERIAQETRLWDEAACVTRTMRSKEGSPDYRYFPDPDLVELHLTPEWQAEIRARIPELQHAKCERFEREYELSHYDADVLTQSKPVADYFEAAVKRCNNAKGAANWVINDVMRVLNEGDAEDANPFDLKVTPDALGELLELIDQEKINRSVAKKIFPEMLETSKAPSVIVKEKGLEQISNTDTIELLVDEQLNDPANASAIADFTSGKEKAIGRIVGQVMKASRDQANPQMVNDLIRKKLLGE
ncbi:Asp-tRNA(Asn)/Glu-tRNA(Gln) amidotransferase subunit GatB [Candidatus Sumerlaeota bacterium]|nr:Asp-tRNA(Asn)/Glu-tRNA(Gln) amidotransferase subunit GatB [Candidatus Sumerlaeota bacterium]